MELETLETVPAAAIALVSFLGAIISNKPVVLLANYACEIFFKILCCC